jgi:hypothetical protein
LTVGGSGPTKSKALLVITSIRAAPAALVEHVLERREALLGPARR